MATEQRAAWPDGPTAVDGPVERPRWGAAGDLLLVAGVVVLSVSLLLAAGGETEARPPALPAAVLLVVAALPLLVRRRWPLHAFAVQLAVVMIYLALNHPGGAELPIVLAGIYGVAAEGHRWWTLGLVLTFVGVGTVYRIVVEGEDALTVTVGGSLLLVVALLGDGVNTRRELREETRRRLAVMTAEKDSEARARVAEERLRIAHELHDVMAHTITVMTVQAGAAADLVDRDPAGARRALDAVRGAARDATAELRAIVGVLRAPGSRQDRAPAPGLERLGELIETVEQSGVRVEVDTDGVRGRVLPMAIDVTCFRVVQEALTNVVRHARARHATVHIRTTGSGLEVVVTNDGRGGGSLEATGDPGFGLIGLRERVAAVGGRLEAGPRPQGGFEVTAQLPIAEGTLPDVGS